MLRLNIVSETEMLMVEGGVGDNGPQKGKDPLYILDGGGVPEPTPDDEKKEPKPDPGPGGSSGNLQNFNV